MKLVTLLNQLRRPTRDTGLSMEVPSSLFKFILGKRAETKKKIEKETNTQILIPRQGEER